MAGRDLGRGCPHHMKNHLAESGIGMMPVSAPVAHAKINFYVPADWRGVSDSQYRIAKVRARFTVPKARMQDPHRTAIHGFELIPTESLVMPDGLDEALGRSTKGRFPKFDRRKTVGSPLGVPAGDDETHWPLLFKPPICKVKRRIENELGRIGVSGKLNEPEARLSC